MSAAKWRRIGGFAVVVLQFVVAQVFAAEWGTSHGKWYHSCISWKSWKLHLSFAGDHCITACKFHNDGNLYYWCTTAFGKQPDKSRKWDYCTPSEFSANLNEMQQEPDDEAHVANSNENSATSRPNIGGHDGIMTALYHQTNCISKKMWLRREQEVQDSHIFFATRKSSKMG